MFVAFYFMLFTMDYSRGGLAQVGPFESQQQCQQVREMALQQFSKGLGSARASECFQGIK